MTATTLSHYMTVSETTGNGVFWLAGDAGSVTFEPKLKTITAHSSSATFGGERSLCQYVPSGCWNDGSDTLGATLYDRWKGAGEDDVLVWTELERWYRDLLEAAV